MRELKRKIVVVTFSPEAIRLSRIKTWSGWVGIARFPRGGPPLTVDGCRSRRKALAVAMAEGRHEWRAFRKRQKARENPRCGRPLEPQPK